MAKVRMSRGKFASINACADGNGIIAATAMDHAGRWRNRSARRAGQPPRRTTWSISRRP